MGGAALAQAARGQHDGPTSFSYSPTVAGSEGSGPTTVRTKCPPIGEGRRSSSVLRRVQIRHARAERRGARPGAVTHYAVSRSAGRGVRPEFAYREHAGTLTAGERDAQEPQGLLLEERARGQPAGRREPVCGAQSW